MYTTERPPYSLPLRGGGGALLSRTNVPCLRLVVAFADGEELIEAADRHHLEGVKQTEGVALPLGSEPGQAHESGEPGGGGAARMGEVDAGDAGPEAVGQEARGAAETRADVEHGHPRADRRAKGQRLMLGLGRAHAFRALLFGRAVTRRSFLGLQRLRLLTRRFFHQLGC